MTFERPLCSLRGEEEQPPHRAAGGFDKLIGGKLLEHSWDAESNMYVSC